VLHFSYYKPSRTTDGQRRSVPRAAPDATTGKIGNTGAAPRAGRPTVQIQASARCERRENAALPKTGSGGRDGGSPGTTDSSVRKPPDRGCRNPPAATFTMRIPPKNGTESQIDDHRAAS